MIKFFLESLKIYEGGGVYIRFELRKSLYNDFVLNFNNKATYQDFTVGYETGFFIW